MKPAIHLVDGSLYVFRAWFAQGADVLDADGAPAHAVHGFTRFLLELLERARPTHLAVAFDESLGSGCRNLLYPAYKANRPPAPPDLLRQFAHCKAIARALGAQVLVDDSFEADDLIGSALMVARGNGYRGVIVSADKDFGQLIGADDEQWDPPRQQRWDGHGVKQRLGVHPHQVADYLALMGDAVDNIPGVSGIGAKTAATLLGHFGSLDALLERSEEVAFLRVRGAAGIAARLREQASMARLSRTLASIMLDAPVPAAIDAYRRTSFGADIEELLEYLCMGPLTRARVHALAASD